MDSKSSTSEGGTSGKPQVTNGERTAQSVGRKRSISDATKETPREEKRKLAALTEESEELIETRKELISGWKKRFPKLMFGIGIKRMGVLDRKPFRDACYRKYQSTHDPEEKASQLRTLWQSKLADPSWHPFQVVKKNGVAQEILFKGDDQLKELKHDLGKEVYDAVCRALTEIEEYGFGEEELWNYCKRRKAPLKEAIGILVRIRED